MDWMLAYQRQEMLTKTLETNEKSERFGLTLTRQDAELLLQERGNALREQKRVEFGGGILPQLIDTFCDSDFICQSNYVETLVRLQEIFYLYKNEVQDNLTDDELLHLMKEQFEFLCFGDLDYLEGTCLCNFAQAVRAGYRGYLATDGRGEYSRFDEVQRWDYELYRETLKELCGR